MTDQPPLVEQVRFELRDDVAWITIDRPWAGNALDPPSRDRLRDLLVDLNQTRRARAAVITATGDKLFCAGADLTHDHRRDRPEGVPEVGVGDVRQMLLTGQYRLFPAILDCEVPVIAAVNGTAAGMGAHLALACDLVVCSDRARFVEVFSRRGLVPDALGSWLLPRLVGLRRTMELFLLAEDVPAAQALELGLVNRVVPHDELEAATTGWARRLAAGPTRAFALTKWLVNQSLDADRAAMIENEALAVELNSRTHDSEEGIASYRERRDPRWRGH